MQLVAGRGHKQGGVRVAVFGQGPNQWQDAISYRTRRDRPDFVPVTLTPSGYRIITDDGPILASTVTYLLPVVAVILGVPVLDETVTLQLVLGVFVVLLGVALSHQPTTAKAFRPAAGKRMT